MGRGCFYQGGAGKKATKRGKLSEIRCLYRWQGARKATQKGERAKICCLSPPVVGKKATKKGKLSEIRCLYRWQEARKATSLKLKEAVHYECSSFFFNRFDASK